MDSVISFGQSVNIEHKWNVKTLDGVKHAKFDRLREGVQITLAPRSIGDNDAAWSALTKPGDYVTIRYPDTSGTFAQREFIVSSITRGLQKYANGRAVYGEITLDCEER